MQRKLQTTRRKLLAMAGAGTAAGLAGCFDGDGGGGGGGDEDPADLPPVHFLTDYNNEPWQDYWEGTLIPDFEEETGIEVDIEYSGFSGGGQESRLATLIQSGDPPALSTGTMVQVGDMYAGGQLSPTTGVVDAIQETVGDLVSEPYRDFDDDTWQIPHGYYTSVLHYRTDVYEELGLEPPESFAELKENARIIDEADMDIRGYGQPGQKTGKSKDEFNVLLANMGARLLRPEDPNADKPIPEVWFPKEEAITLLEHMKDMAQYSPDPTSISWGQSIKGWISSNYAQQYHLNAWPQGIAAANGIDEVAENTGVTSLPVWEEGGITRDDTWRSNPTPDGHFVYEGSDNPEGAREFMKWLYADDAERTASMYHTEPTRFLPNYEDVLATDRFQNIEIFQDNSFLLDQLEKVQNEIFPRDYGNVEKALVLGNLPEPIYVQRFFFLGEMVNQVLASDRDPEAAYEEAKGKAEERLAEAEDTFSEIR